MIPCALFAVCEDPDGARREAQLPDYTPSGPPLSVPVEPADSQTHLQSDGEGLPGKLVVRGVDASAHTA